MGLVVLLFAVLLGPFRIVTTLGVWGALLSGLAIVLPFLFYGALNMAGGLLFQWLPKVSETLTEILSNIERIEREGGEIGATTGS